ncbi:MULTISPECIES: TIGR03089 family protein [Corynebacterium]|jgi:uncharacterized protein (TIGR03089 family)|uniref:TIGR03089 family protein n=1 Tax=Corynebacterium TaxID=1716 RepID=UPI000829FF97|nr:MULTISPECIES: TIGR03089 family protein [Corynebacterium]MCI1256389.1 TIGR03089 family protein [Corynebacterium provencense]
MDLTAPLLASDPSCPRITTYTPRGRMELSAATVANWAAKAGNYFSGELGLGPGDVVVVDCPTNWLPAVLVPGCWQAGAAVCSPSSPAASDAAALLTADPDSAFATGFDAEILQISGDPFGRGVVESGGTVPFGVTDLIPDLRVQADRYTGPVTGDTVAALVTVTGDELTGDDLRHLAARSGQGVRLVSTGWEDADGLVRRLLPLFTGGSVVLSTDADRQRLEQLAQVEKATVSPGP